MMEGTCFERKKSTVPLGQLWRSELEEETIESNDSQVIASGVMNIVWYSRVASIDGRQTGIEINEEKSGEKYEEQEQKMM